MKNITLTMVVLMAGLITNFSLYAYEGMITICETKENVNLPASEVSMWNNVIDGTLICWIDERYSGSLCMQKLDTDGKIMWTENGAVIHSGLGFGTMEDSDYPILFSDNRGGAIVIYCKEFSGYKEIFAAKVAYSGDPLSVVCLSDYFPGYNFAPAAVKSNTNEIFVTWENFARGNYDIHAQKIDFSLNKLFDSGKEIVICNNPADQRSPTVTVGSNGTIFIVWLDSRNHAEYNFDLFACRLEKTSKHVVSNENIKQIFSNRGEKTVNLNDHRKVNMYNHNLVASDKNTFLVAFEHSLENENEKVAVMKIDENLKTIWTKGVESESSQSYPLIARDDKYGAHLIWKNAANDREVIQSGRFSKDGGLFISGKYGTLVSCDNLKNFHSRTIPSSRNTNGMFFDRGILYTSWVTGGVNKLFIKSLSLSDESGQCRNSIEIDDQITEGELTSITAQTNKLIVVYKKNDDLFAAVRKLDNNDLRTASQKISLDNFPNPFNPSTHITYNIPEDGFVRISIYDVTGRIIYKKPAEFRKAGSYDFIFDGSHLPAGVYFYRLETNGHVMTNKMMMIK